MKKIIAISLVVLTVVALFTGCAVDARTAETENLPIVEINETVPEETEASTEAKTTTEKPTETTTAETTTEKPTEVTTKAETTTRKETTTQKPTTTKTPETTTKKAETTTQKPATTKKQETTTQKPSTTKKAETTTKKQETTTQKPTTTKKAETTTKPVPATTEHVHDWQEHYSERKVLVKDAWDEPIYEVTHHSKCIPPPCLTCGAQFDNCNDLADHCYFSNPRHDSGSTGATYLYWDTEELVGYEHHEAEYKTEKYVNYYTCACGAKKDA